MICSFLLGKVRPTTHSMNGGQRFSILTVQHSNFCATAMLAQANASKQGVLSLLPG
jgi:hypothetical protein